MHIYGHYCPKIMAKAVEMVDGSPDNNKDRRKEIINPRSGRAINLLTIELMQLHPTPGPPDFVTDRLI